MLALPFNGLDTTENNMLTYTHKTYLYLRRMFLTAVHCLLGTNILTSYFFLAQLLPRSMVFSRVDNNSKDSEAKPVLWLATEWTTRIRFMAGAPLFSLHHFFPKKGCGAHPTCSLMGARASCLWLKWSGV